MKAVKDCGDMIPVREQELVTVPALMKILNDYHVDPQRYSLEGGRPEERLVFDEMDGMFAVYWVERGCRSLQREFASKSESLEYFGWCLIGKATERRGHGTLLRAHWRVYSRSFGRWGGTGTLHRAVNSGAGWQSVYREYPISGRLSHLLSRIAMVQFR